MNALPRMDRYWKEVLQVSTYKEWYKGSVYFYDKLMAPRFEHSTSRSNTWYIRQQDYGVLLSSLILFIYVIDCILHSMLLFARRFACTCKNTENITFCVKDTCFLPMFLLVYPLWLEWILHWVPSSSLLWCFSSLFCSYFCSQRNTQYMSRM